MPDILIRGMEMPHNCFQCPLFSNCDACEGHECGCGLLGGIGYEEDISEDRRRDDCPLLELPPHGDLVDIQNGVTDAKFILFNDEPNDYQLGWNDGIDAVCHYAPVVVPAERSDADA